MTASILDGKAVSSLRRNDLKIVIEQRTKNGHSRPKLAVILIGDDPASAIYVKNKRKACQDVGIEAEDFNLPASTKELELLNLIDSLNENHSVDGILVQLPLPKHINTTSVIERILPKKDVDGFHPYNVGRLAQRIPLLRPCTPLGIIHLLEYYNIPFKKQHAVIIGASNIVGRPMSLELLLAGSTVTICHKFTHNLQQHVRSADILVVASGAILILKLQLKKFHG